ncbi:MAG: LPS translocon maturation chaperone LptM [Steroidobacteraceae bacterium]
MRTRTSLAAAALLFGCSACGFKGPLYLPPHNGTVVTRPAPTTGPAAQHKTPARKTAAEAPPGPPA